MVGRFTLPIVPPSKRASGILERIDDMRGGVLQNYRTLLRYKGLIDFMTTTRHEGQVFGTVLGRAWFLLDPFLHMFIYYLVLVVIFRAGNRYGVHPFVFIMLGLSHYYIIQRAVTNASMSIVSQRNLLMQVSIEPLVFPAISLNHTLREFAVFAGLYAVFYIAIGPDVPPNVILYPIILALLIMLAWGFAVLTATAAVFVRDLSKVAAVVLRLLLYASPVIYAVDFVPEKYRNIYLYNPVACLFSLLQWSFFNHPMPSVHHIVTMVVFVLVTLVLAHGVYNRGKLKFTKVL